MSDQVDFDKFARDIVYMKPVATRDLPADVQEQAGERKCLVSVHDVSGKEIALVSDMQLAQTLASQYKMQAVRLH